MYECKDDPVSIANPGTNADIVFNYTKGDWRQKFGEQVGICPWDPLCEHYGEFKQSKW